MTKTSLSLSDTWQSASRPPRFATAVCVVAISATPDESMSVSPSRSTTNAREPESSAVRTARRIPKSRSPMVSGP